MTVTDRKRLRCKHFNGIQHASCNAGVIYDSVSLAALTGGVRRGLPCFGTCDSLNHDGATCEQYCPPTAEELEAEEIEARQRLVAIATARMAIVDHLGGAWKRGAPGASGSIDCPVCGGQGRLKFSRARYNGHIHAMCTTDGCVSWIE